MMVVVDVVDVAENPPKNRCALHTLACHRCITSTEIRILIVSYSVWLLLVFIFIFPFFSWPTLALKLSFAYFAFIQHT